MIARGLGYRGESDAVSDAKVNRMIMMLQQYPPDVTKSVTTQLWGKWMPTVDEMEQHMRAKVAWRREIFDALIGCEIISQEQVRISKERRLAMDVIEAMRPFPIWDNGKENRHKRWTECVAVLKDKVITFTDYANAGHGWEREINEALEYINGDFVPYPYAPLSLEDRQALIAEEKAEREAKTKIMIASLMDDGS